MKKKEIQEKLKMYRYGASLLEEIIGLTSDTSKILSDKTAGDICFKCYAEDAMQRMELLEPFLEEYEDELMGFRPP